MQDALIYTLAVILIIAAVEAVWLGSLIRRTRAMLKSAEILQESAEDDLRKIDQLYVELRKKERS